MTGLRRHPALRLLAPLLLLLCFAASAAPAQEPLRHGQGLLWRIETPGKADSYLFGTMHATDPQIVTLPTQVLTALRAARSLTLEIVMSDAVQQTLGAAMVLTDGRRLQNIIGAHRFAALAQIGQLYDFQPPVLDHFAPWAAMTVISIAPSEYRRIREGVAPLDQALQDFAVTRGVPVHGLETVEEQIAVFRDVPEQEQIALLDLAIRSHANIEGWFQQMKAAYLTRDLARLTGLMNEQTSGGDLRLLQAFESRLIEARNVRMAVRMAERLDAGGAFVAVGALHLPGDKGVVHLLERQGRRLTRLY